MISAAATVPIYDLARQREVTPKALRERLLQTTALRWNKSGDIR
jgi:hypothetical protein